MPFNQNKKHKSYNLGKFIKDRERLLKSTKISGTTTILHREDGRWVTEVKNITYTVPLKRGPFPKEITDHCKDCKEIYCPGWTVEQTEYFIFWHCPKYTIQEKNKWVFILK